MKRKVGIFDAKTKFSELVGQVCSSGQTVTVTNRGKPVVDIAPARCGIGYPMSQEQAFREIARLRAEIPPVSKAEIRELIEEGRG
ncbi:MAG: type II toxin-antitoxin system prevent-host-death family antitoxin [Opitutae bacterium]|nr:type II toxin-antitoxin system prevent-host-death family antitoxin [Opitutae bacterium]